MSNSLHGSKNPGGLIEVLKIALPLVLSALSHALNLFTDRVMLNRYSQDAMAAAFPAGLTAFYEQSFRYRFASEDEYNAVSPLLRMLLEKESVSIEEAARQIPTVGKLVKLLQGYCVVNNNTLSLCDATLREWLLDSIKNPDFAIF